ncbi:MAG TPA: HlyD family secretion protein [Acidisoma sp.]|uniref:HlyD family secretion protein n=1 Tax=Acidisoma sp. TaxID=1872115 RepID=UPI002BCBCB02|nr:HlyD family secretion protein [Acidisoma sp.]HTI00470.1 HlyD family secretion protein [Acidisoma sp.]
MSNSTARIGDLAPGQTEVETRPRRKLRPRRLALGLLALAAIGGGAWYGDQWWRVGRFVMSTDDAYVGGDVTPISPHVSGFVSAVLVRDNQFVPAGQPLLRIDPADFEAALGHAEAVLAERQAAVSTLVAQQQLQRSVLAEAGADLAARKAEAVFAAADARRYQTLAHTEAGSRQDAERAMAAVQSAQAEVAAAEAKQAAANQQLALIETQIAGAEATIRQAEADLRTARLNRSYTEIDAPIAGYVGDRSAQLGAYVTAGTNLLSLVPAEGLWVDANFKEDDLARMQPGEPAQIVADILPGRIFHGHVGSLAPATGAVFSVIPPQNATGNFTKIVQRVPVRILLDDADARLGLLRAGLSVTVSVDTRGEGRPAS